MPNSLIVARITIRYFNPLTILFTELSQRLRTCSLPNLRMLFETASPGRIQTSEEEPGEEGEGEHEKEIVHEQEELEGDDDNEELDEEDGDDDDDDDDEDEDDDEEEELNVGRCVYMIRKCLSLYTYGIVSSILIAENVLFCLSSTFIIYVWYLFLFFKNIFINFSSV